MDDLVHIASTEIAASVSPLGAELKSLRTAGGTEVLWPGDTRSWDASSPLLFPVIGRNRLMPIHGFALGRRFDCIEAAPARVSWRLTDDAATRALFPHAFTLDISYTVNRRSLVISVGVGNPGAAVLPASFGFHPGFRWPVSGAKTDYAVRFESAEAASIRHASAGYLMPDGIPNPMRGQELALTEGLFATGAIIFPNVSSRRIALRDRDRTLLQVTFEGCPNLALWSRPGGDFICIEPWNGLPQTEAFDGGLADRPGTVLLAPGQRMRMAMRIDIGEGIA